MQCLREGLHGELGRAVDAEAGTGAVSADGGDVEDAAGAPGTHVGQHSAGHGEQAEHVGSVDRLDLLRRRLLDRSDQTEAGIVEQDVDGAEALHGAGRGRMSLRFVGDVELYGQQARVVAQRLGHGGRIARGGDHVVAPLQGEGGHLRPESARRAGDEPGLHEVGPSTAQRPTQACHGHRAEVTGGLARDQPPW